MITLVREKLPNYVHADLFEVVDAGGRLRLVSGLVQRGQQHGGENRDDCNHDEKLNKSEMECFSADGAIIVLPVGTVSGKRHRFEILIYCLDLSWLTLNTCWLCIVY